ncbi:prepilin peptidase [Rhodococcus sp. WB9]|uniref:prepilin peptidase n=1 Tax=Rhodococcus sp. WB9 TaxID=2594007 RepID=UPI001185E3D6|nr:A24 family peptidase [Rhodococcus sp. WB9]QDQ92462.1 prepilin peptidase [Rhodococcus sp. WB9]
MSCQVTAIDTVTRSRMLLGMWWLIAVSVVSGAGAGWAARLTSGLFVGRVRPGWCEAVCAVGVAVTVWACSAASAPWVLPCALAFWWWCVSLAATDLCARRLPNLLTLPGFLAIVVGGAATGSAAAAVIGGFLLAAAYLALYLGAPGAVGAGDVKLALGVGAAAGLAGGEAWVLAAGLAPALTALAGGIVLAVRRSPSPLPHGPAMCAATLVALFAAHVA